ncbi:hypothetical protein [Microcoleus sp. K5-D4]|uniref:hypothetical protein n=1 Tax=Microcoleus sp. K5-D4 TaxID=2818801 RepID=UPI002FD15A52
MAAVRSTRGDRLDISDTWHGCHGSKIAPFRAVWVSLRSLDGEDCHGWHNCT